MSEIRGGGPTEHTEDTEDSELDEGSDRPERIGAFCISCFSIAHYLNEEGRKGE